jgi:outer membrane protein assembly factor BamE (lipoprotein component of BamABCDE complex)
MHEVQEIYGEPTEVSFTDGGNQIWKYTYVHATSKAVNFVPIINLFAAGANYDQKELVILFDEDDIVKNYTMRESEGEFNQNLSS